MLKFELNRSLTELQLTFNIDDVEGNFLPFQEISLGDKMPIVFNNKILVANWNHALSNDIFFSDQIKSDLFQNDFFRCVVPIDGFFYTDCYDHKTHYFEKNKSLFFAVAICDKENNFDFILTKIDNPIIPYIPLTLQINEINNWLGPTWESIIRDTPSVNLDFMSVLQLEGPGPVFFTHVLNQIKTYRSDLNKQLKSITPSIYQFI